MARILSIALLIALAAVAWAADSKSTSLDPAAIGKLMADAAKPSTDLQKLKPLAGNWTYTCKFWMDPSQQAIESKGSAQRKWILGDRFLEEKVQGAGFDGKTDFEGCGIM